MDSITIKNIQEANYYIQNKILPIRVFKGSDGVVVFLFNKKDTRKYYDIWCKQNIK